MTQEEEFAAFQGLNDSYVEMHKQLEKIAPRCHFRPMLFQQGEMIEGYCEEWWECSVCGHIKLIK